MHETAYSAAHLVLIVGRTEGGAAILVNLILFIAKFLPQSWMEQLLRIRCQHPRFEPYFRWLADSLRNREKIIQKGAGAGLRFNPGRSHASYLLGINKPELQSVFAEQLREGMTVFDVGANVGFFAMIAARLVGPAGRVVCFEPLPPNVQQLEANANLNNFRNVDVRPVALGAEDGEATFLVSEEPTWGTLKSVGTPPDRLIGETSVTIRRLDLMIADGEVPPPDFMKIDVEGAEIALVEGAWETLKRYRPTLVIEMHATNERMASLLEELGYRVQVLGSEEDLARSHWNCHALAIPVNGAGSGVLKSADASADRVG